MSDTSRGPDNGPSDASPTAPYDPPPPPQPPMTPPAAPAPAAPTAWSRRRDDAGRSGTIFFGVILVAIGLWFFADQTLGLEMPRLRWNELWPILLVGLGAWIVFGSLRRD
jgi:hypothetical protein